MTRALSVSDFSTAIQPIEEGRGALASVGHFLDTPGAFFRGALAGQAGTRVSGKDLLRSLGAQDPGGLAGFAAEVVLDPLNLVGGLGGLTKVGKAAKGLKIAASRFDQVSTAIRAGIKFSTKVDEADRIADTLKFATRISGEFDTAIKKAADVGLDFRTGETGGYIISKGETVFEEGILKQTQGGFRKAFSFAGVELGTFGATGSALEKADTILGISDQSRRLGRGLSLTKGFLNIGKKTDERITKEVSTLITEQANQYARAFEARGVTEFEKSTPEAFSNLSGKLEASFRDPAQTAKVFERFKDGGPALKKRQAIDNRLLAIEEGVTLQERELLKLVQTTNSMVLAKEKGIGRFITDLKDNPDNIINYMFRTMTPEGSDLVASNGAARQEILSFTKGAFGRGRNKRDLNKTVSEFNALMKKKFDLDYNVIEENPFVATAERIALSGEETSRLFTSVMIAKNLSGEAADMGKSKSIEEFLSKARVAEFEGIKLPGKNIKMSQERHEAILAAKLKGSPFEGLRIPVEVVERNSLIMNMFADPDSQISEFWKIYDGVHNLYKRALTQFFPAFHVRNGMSNVFLNMLGGVYDVRDYGTAFKIQQIAKKVEGGTQIGLRRLEGAGIEGLTKEEVALYDIWLRARAHDVVGKGGAFFQDLSGEQVKRKLRGKGATVAGSEQSKLRKLGARLNEGALSTTKTVEENARLAHFINKTRKGVNDFDAAFSVKKYLFDYADLSAVERKVARRTFLFYTFTRKNIPNLIEAALQDPGKAAAYFRAAGLTRRDDEVPPWAQAGFDIPWLGSPSERAVLSLGLPPEDVGQVFGPSSGVKGFLLGSVNPIIRTAIESATNTELLTGRELRPRTKLEAIGLASPASRLVSTIKRFRKDPTADKPRPFREAVSAFAGLPLRTFNPDIERVKNRKAAVQGQLDNLVSEGFAFRFPVVAASKEARRLQPEKGSFLTQLRRKQTKDQKQLKQLRSLSVLP